ncbi:MAG: T9SS type A sorting domain-containing protein [Chitinophagales bacterium]
MKKLLLSTLSILLIYNLSFAQSTAMDWTKNDCDGISHNLYTELEEGNVILSAYVMTCGSCISAANYLEQIYLDYSVSNPDKVKFYAIDWNTSFTCSSFESWASGLSCTLFLDGYDEVNYYGGMGMPTVVVLGGSDHTVYYDKLGYNHSTDDQAIRDAIDAALSTTGINQIHETGSSIDVFPNPATTSVNISFTLNAAAAVSLDVMTILGSKVQTINLGMQSAGQNSYQLSIGKLNSGLYFVQLNYEGASEAIKLMVLN